MNDAWANFTAEAARRFPNAVFEIWNEPNIPQFWRSGPNPTRYAELVRIAYNAIKQVNPSQTVLVGGLDNNQTTNGGEGSGGVPAIPMKSFLQRAYTAPLSIKGHLDAISVHTTSQEMNYGAGSLFAKVLHDARVVAHKNGDKGMHIWVTEAGLSTTGTQALTWRAQADGAMRQYRRLMTMKDVDGVLFNSLIEGTAPRTSVNAGYGFVLFQQPKFPPKLAFCAFADRASSIPPIDCPALWEPTLPGDPRGLHKHAIATCRKWFKPSVVWQLADHAGHKAILNACVASYLALKHQGQLAPLLASAKQQCQASVPPATHWRHHGVKNRRAALVKCRYGHIRRGLHIKV